MPTRLFKKGGQGGSPLGRSWRELKEEAPMYRREVKEEARKGSRMGISGVPFFICSREADDESDSITLSGPPPPTSTYFCVPPALSIYVFLLSVSSPCPLVAPVPVSSSPPDLILRHRDT